MLSTSTIISSFIFMQMNHPLAMGLMLLIQTLLICLITGIMSQSFWYSYILFLIFLGGMLVLFIYVTSLASNEMFSLSMKLTSISLIMFLLIMLSTILIDLNSLTFMFNNNDMETINNIKSFFPENSLSLSKLYNYPTNWITLMLMIYLLITLIAIVKISNMAYGPIRSMNN